MLTDLLHAWADLEAATPGYQTAQNYFTGDIEEFFASPRIRAYIASTGMRYRFNLAKTPVQAMADRVELAAVTVPGNETANTAIGRISDANDLAVHFPDLIVKTFEYGDAYMMGWPVVDEPGLDPRLAAAGVEATVVSPLNCRVIYDPEKPRRKAYAIHRWCLRTGIDQYVWRVDLWYPDRMERWVSKVGAPLTETSSWEHHLDDDETEDDWEIENPFGVT